MSPKSRLCNKVYIKVTLFIKIPATAYTLKVTVFINFWFMLPVFIFFANIIKYICMHIFLSIPTHIYVCGYTCIYY